MGKLYYHRVENFNGLRSIKGIKGYAKRALTMAEFGDFVILDWYDGFVLPPPEIKVLNEMGLGARPEDIFVVNFNGSKSWRENYLENKKVIEVLRGKKINELIPFTGKSPIVHLLAGELGIIIESCPLELCVWGEDAATLLELSDRGDIPRGFVCRSNKEILDRWSDLKSLPGFAGLGLIKNRHSASGLLSSIVRNEDDIKAFLEVYDFGKLGGATFQEWIENDLRSPSINYFIKKSGEIKELFISDQIFADKAVEFGREGTRIHAGNICPSTYPKDVQDKIRKLTMPFAEKMKDNGYWGPVGFDTIVLPDSQVLVAEINARITGPHYGYRPAKKFGCGCFRMKNEELKNGVGIKELKDALGELLMAPGKSGGYIPFNFYPGNKFTGVAVAKTPDGLNKIIEKVDKAIKSVKI